jgi:DNA-directed RNA polymerase II subunit RPB11
LRYRQLLKDTNVRFSGYRKPHPLENMVEIKVQTDGSKTPAMAVIEACDKTLNHITAIQNSFEVSGISSRF